MLTLSSCVAAFGSCNQPFTCVPYGVPPHASDSHMESLPGLLAFGRGRPACQAGPGCIRPKGIIRCFSTKRQFLDRFLDVRRKAAITQKIGR